jgi:hypothetical protein
MAAIRAGLRATRSGKPIGRPRRLTPELLARIVELRDTSDAKGSQRTWAQIAQSVHHLAGSCKKWYSASRSETSRVINPLPGFGSARGT